MAAFRRVPTTPDMRMTLAFHNLFSGPTGVSAEEAWTAMLEAAPALPTAEADELRAAVRDRLPPNHFVLEEADTLDGHVAQTVSIGPEGSPGAVEYQRIVHPDEAYAEHYAAEAKVADLTKKLSAHNEEISQTLGKALGYPWIKDDQKNFPGSTEADGVCVGDHVAETLATEAATRIASLEAALAEQSRRADEATQAELDRLYVLAHTASDHLADGKYVSIAAWLMEQGGGVPASRAALGEQKDASQERAE